MLTLIKNVECYCPEYQGEKDILISYDKILAITNPGEFEGNKLIENIYDGKGKMAVPGLIDQHVHITGGGGEKGPASRIKEIDSSEVLEAGVTTLVGVLGADSYTRSMENLLAKAIGLEAQGITTYIYTGSYAIPPVTLTGNVASDLVCIEKVIGVGELAISDHRSTHPDIHTFARICSEAHIGGLISGKAGIVHVHVGDGKKMLQPIEDLINETEIPVSQFVPTHINRNRDLFNEGIKFCKKGGYIDLTAAQSPKTGVSVPDALKKLLEEGVDMGRVTVSSDANGSVPDGEAQPGAGSIKTLFEDIRKSVKIGNVPIDIAIRTVTENVARILNLFPGKGTIRKGSFADILILDRQLEIEIVYAGGNPVYDRNSTGSNNGINNSSL